MLKDENVTWWEPCEKFNLAMFMPAIRKFAIILDVLDFGPDEAKINNLHKVSLPSVQIMDVFLVPVNVPEILNLEIQPIRLLFIVIKLILRVSLSTRDYFTGFFELKIEINKSMQILK